MGDLQVEPQGFSVANIRRWVREEEDIRGETGRKRETKRVRWQDKRNRGLYPEMERELSKFINVMRSEGLPVETWMLPLEVRTITNNQHNNKQNKITK
jgi:hypothetical protein